MPTMKDVAREAGVALGTVSKVVNNQPVGEEYKIKVEEAIEKLGYEVDVYARGMKMQKTNTIALIIPNLTNPFFAAFAYYVELELSANNYKLLLCNSDGKEEKEISYVNMAKQNKVDGIIGITYSKIDAYVSKDISFVTIDRHFSSSKLCVASDNYGGGALAARTLIEKGCKKLAFVKTGSSILGETYKRKLGFIDTCEEINIPYYTFELEEPYEDLDNYITEIILNHKNEAKLEMDGIFASTDLLAYQIKCILEKMGFNIPKDVQIIGFDGIRAFGSLNYFVSSIKQPIDLLAKKCVELSLDQINGKKVEGVTCLPVEFVEGGTTR